MFCTKCGKGIADESVFCPECGQDLRNLSAEKPQNTNEVQPAPAASYEPVVPAAAPVTAAAVTQPESTDAPYAPNGFRPAAAAQAAPYTSNGYTRPAAAAQAAPNASNGYAQSTQNASSSYTQFGGAGTKQQSSGDVGSQISGFFKEYFKNPIAAVSSRAADKYWLWGLVSIAAYLFVQFIISIIGTTSVFGLGYNFGYSFGYSFGHLLADIANFAAFIFVYFLFQSVFKVKKKSLLSIVSVTGLAFLPILPVYLVDLAFTRIFSNGSIFSGLMTAVYIIAGIILFSELKESSDEKSGFHSLLTIAVAFACMPVIGGIIDVIVNKILYNVYY